MAMTREFMAGRGSVRTSDAGHGQRVYGRPVVPLPTAEQAGSADRAARERHGIPDRVLMESAGRAAALVLDRLFPRGRIAGAAGSGHNGGDLAVMLRVLRSWGRDVALVNAAAERPDAALLHGADLEIVHADSSGRAFATADVIVDGLLGTGARGAPRGAIAECIRSINESQRPVVALDVPSGTDATTGTASPDAITAAATVTFGWPKLGLMLHPARAHCGRIIAVEIGFPDDVVAADAALITPSWVRRHLPARSPAAHKGTAGRLLLVAGQEGMAGAAAIAARAAARAGAGMVRIASASANRIVLQSLVPEATFVDRLCVTAADAEPAHALVIGPGLGTDDDASSALRRALELTSTKPVLIDADGLNLFARDPDALGSLAESRPVIITPHPLELSRLTRTPAEDIVADTPKAARAAARNYNCIVLLKGQPSLVAAPDGTLLVNSVGSSDVATAGMGDQLAGVAGAFLAAGIEPLHAAALGLFLSSRAADIAGLGRSLVPSDVNDSMPEAIADPGPYASPLGLPFITFDQPARR